MTAPAIARPFHPPHATDLPPEIAAFIDAEIVRRAGPATTPRPLMRIVPDPARDAPLILPRLNAPKRRSRVLALDDLVLAGLFVGLILAAWISLLVGLNIADAAVRITESCTTTTDGSTASRPALDRKFCDRLPQQG